MTKNLRKLMLLGMVGILTLGGVIQTSNAESGIIGDIKEQTVHDNDETLIKNVVEKFIQDDYNFNGGKNDLTTIGTDEFKQYIIARNKVKETNNANIGYFVTKQKFEFDYKKFEKQGDYIKVDLYANEIFSYTDPDGGFEDAEAGNNYTVYLSKRDNEWKVMSASIDVDLDPVDHLFNVNKELGYEENLKNRSMVDKNLNLMLNELDNLDEKYSKPLKEEQAGEIEEFDSGNKATRGAITNAQRQQIYDYAYAYRQARRNPNYLSFSSDCANYASQALRKAGARADKNHKIYIDNKYRTWSLTPDSNHIRPTYGDAWAQAHYLRAFIVRNENGYRGPGGYTIQYGSNLKLGDLTFVHNGQKWFHTYIVIVPGPNFKIASHTYNRWGDHINTVAPESIYQRSYVHLTTLN